jgi:hypothetical protein
MQIFSTSMIRMTDASGKAASLAVEGLEAGVSYVGLRALC